MSLLFYSIYLCSFQVPVFLYSFIVPLFLNVRISLLWYLSCSFLPSFIMSFLPFFIYFLLCYPCPLSSFPSLSIYVFRAFLCFFSSLVPPLCVYHLCFIFRSFFRCSIFPLFDYRVYFFIHGPPRQYQKLRQKPKNTTLPYKFRLNRLNNRIKILINAFKIYVKAIEI